MPHCGNSQRNKHAHLLNLGLPMHGLLVPITKKNRLYKSYLKNRNDYYFSKYKIYRNKLKHLIISKKSYYNNNTMVNSVSIVLRGTFNR
jgi:hypothetical protein